MPELVTRVILLAIVLYVFWVWVLQRVPKVYLTWLGGIFIVLFVLIAFLEPTNDAVSAVADVLFFPFTPLGLSLILIASALRGGVKSISNGGQILAALIILTVASLPIVAYTLTEQAQVAASAQLPQERLTQPVAAIVVLGDGTNPTDPIYRAGGPINQLGGDFGTGFYTRLDYAAQLYQLQSERGNQPFVVVSPGVQIEADGTVIEENIRAILTGKGVPNELIIVDTKSKDIRSSALAVSELLAAQGLKVELLINEEERVPVIDRRSNEFSIILVSPALSMRRTRLTFAQALNLPELNVVPVPTDFYAFQLQGELSLARFRDLIPNAEALALSTRVVKEYLIYMYYFIRGWLLNPLEY